MTGFSSLTKSFVLLTSLFSSNLCRQLEEKDLLITSTKLCSAQKDSFCLSYNEKEDQIELGKRVSQVLKWDVYLSNEGGYKFVTSEKAGTPRCLIKKESEEMPFPGLTLVSCDSVDEEIYSDLSFAVSEVKDQLSLSPMYNPDLCLTLTYEKSGDFEIPTKRVQLHTGSYVALAPCSEVNTKDVTYAQLFQTVDTTDTTLVTLGETASSVRTVRSASVNSMSVFLATPAPTRSPRYGSFCLDTQRDLCLGVSLTNGTDLEADKLVQVKNSTKNDNKGLSDLKILWYKNDEMEATNKGKFASAAEFDYCMEARYNVSMGENKLNQKFYDDAVHLGLCDTQIRDTLEENDKQIGSYEEEIFEIVDQGGYYEIQTRHPVTGALKCASVIKCVRHELGQCTKYNSKPVYDSKDLEQGSYVRLKDCDSANMPSQRFIWTPDFTQTVPPTKAPTKAPTPKQLTLAPTPQPTLQPTNTRSPTTKAPTTRSPTLEVTATPTSSPVITDEGQKPTEQPEEVPNTNDSSSTGMAVGLALLGVACVAVLAVVGTVYYKSKGFKKVAEDDDTFVARV